MDNEKTLFYHDECTEFDFDTLAGTIDIMLYQVESSLQSNGAVSGIDYTYKDLYNMALPFALEVFKHSLAEGKPLSYFVLIDDPKSFIGTRAENMLKKAGIPLTPCHVGYQQKKMKK